MSEGMRKMSWHRGWHAVAWGCTSFTRGLKLSRAAILSITGHCASPDLNYIAGIRLQSIQLDGVLLAGHGGGDAFALQCHENGGIFR